MLVRRSSRQIDRLGAYAGYHFQRELLVRRSARTLLTPGGDGQVAPLHLETLVESPRPAYYAIIPAPVRYDRTVCSSAKLLYGEITALCEKKGYCWASNSYFADLYSVSDRSITTWLGELVRGGHITTRGKDKRTIWIGRQSAENFHNIRRKLRT